MQGRLAQGEAGAGLVTLGSLFYEPVWVFYRGKSTLERIADLRGRRVAIGPPGSGTHLAAPGVRLMDRRRADAYVRRLPYLHKLTLPEGVVDLKRGIPPQAVTMVALSANLVAREQLHPVAVELLLSAARRVHGGPTLLHGANVFPAPKDIDLPLSSDADRFYKEQPSLLRRLLPFWVAVWLERMLFIALAIPVIAYLPRSTTGVCVRG